jgi:hypothetical protein
LNQVLPSTAKWASNLPAGIQPLALLQKLPRIANVIARAWGDGVALDHYMDELLVDRRGGRQGLPPEIHNELLTLRQYHNAQYPGASTSGK